jgi:hypothetical protein
MMFERNHDTDDVETYLRTFAPRGINPLVLAEPSVARRRKVLLWSVAVAVLAVTLTIVLRKPTVNPVEEFRSNAITVRQFNALSGTEDDLERTLRETANSTLVSVDRPNTALKTLSKD